MALIRRTPLVSRIAACAALVLALVVPAAASAAGNVQTQAIGSPVWKPTDLNLFSAPIGTAASGYAEFGQTIAEILPEPNHRPNPSLGLGPGDPHPPPYNHEIRSGLQALALQAGGQFSVADNSNGNGVWLGYMVIPRSRGIAPEGSSPDFALGPIIPNRLFPIHVKGSSERFGEPFDPALADFSVPPLDASLDPPFYVDGHSHFPVFLATNADFAPVGVDPAGDYRWTITMLDRTGNGWAITVGFTVRGG